MTSSPPRIGVFGGSFDPPHFAHLFHVLVALESGAMDRVHIVPTARHPWGKQPAASFAERVALCRAAFRRFGDAVVVDPREGDREGPSYMIDTVRSILAEHPGATARLIGGTDVVRDMAQWREGAELLRLAPPFESRRLDPTRRMEDQEGAFPPLSSTHVRARLAAGEECGHLVPGAVLEMIAERGLYR